MRSAPSLDPPCRSASSPAAAEFLPILKGTDEPLEKMQRQDRVANGEPIIWHVAESAAVDAMRALLKEAKVQELTIGHTP
jgi:hypothetical protein